MSKVLNPTITGPLLAFIVVVVIAGVTTDSFFEASNLANLALQVSVVSIVAIGATMVILTGGIDLSPGSAIALLSMVLAILIRDYEMSLAAAIVLALLTGGILGAINGLMATYLRIPAFIATLAAFSAFRGLAFIPTNGAPIFSLSENLSQIFYGSFLGVPLPFYYVVATYSAAFVFLNLSPVGRKIYAIGGNATAARLSGINVLRIQCLVFVIAGLTAAAGAVLFAARLNSGSPNYGVGMELQAIAAAVIGGASLAGGRGQILGTLLGALIIAIVQNAMNLNGIGSSMQAVIIGGIILVAVGIDRWRAELARAVRVLIPASIRAQSRASAATVPLK